VIYLLADQSIACYYHAGYRVLFIMQSLIAQIASAMLLLDFLNQSQIIKAGGNTMSIRKTL
jgi:hypothetical protein